MLFDNLSNKYIFLFANYLYFFEFFMINYGEKDYWDKRYAENKNNITFDWLEDYLTLKPIIKSVI